MDQFISCDWGTTSFRMRLIKKDELRIEAEVITDDGIATMYNRWINSGSEENERFGFYHNFLEEQQSILEQEYGGLLAGIPIVLSGMASSSVGMMELPYKQLPFLTNGSDINVKLFNDNLLIVSGTRTDNDVLRGEETMLIGCADISEKDGTVYIFPGTHSKHIFVQEGKATGFKTYMTGEIFDLLSNKSILSNSVRKPSGKMNNNSNYFREGFEKGYSGNLLNVSFSVRTNQLLRNISPENNYEFLSGMIIGAELKDIDTGIPIVLVCSETQRNLYMQGLEMLRGNKRVKYADADRALIKGQEIILQRFSDQLN